MGKLLNKKIVIWGLIILYRLLLDHVYVNVTNPVWGYAGFSNNATQDSLITSWLVLVFLSMLVVPLFNSKAAFYPDLLILFFVMRVVPFTSLIRFINTPNRLSILFAVYFSLIFILTRIIRLRQVPLSISGISRSKDTIMYVGLFFFATIILFISGYYAHFHIHLSFDDVYDLRHQVKSFNLPTIVKYAWSPATNVLPLLFVFFLERKKKVICAFIVLLIMLNFSINGMKSTFFKLLICVSFILVRIKDFKRYYIPLFITLLLLVVVEGRIWNLHVIHDVVVRRALFVPSILDTFYYDYISQYGPVFYARGGMPVQYIIGDIYFGSSDIECNNGLFSDAFMNLGWLGCIVYPFIYAILFRICGSAFRAADKGLIVFAAIIMSYTLEGSELTTGLLTHGLFLFGVFMYLISVKNYKRNKIVYQNV